MSSYFLPVLFLLIFITAIVEKVKPYDAFLEGVKKAVPFAVSIFPYLCAVFVISELFEVSGLAETLTKFLSPAFSLIGIPKELVKLVMLKPFSGSGSLAVLSDIYSKYGVDSYLARAASAIYGSSETVFYVAGVYFANAKTKRLQKAILISLFASLCSSAFACLICHVL